MDFVNLKERASRLGNTFASIKPEKEFDLLKILKTDQPSMARVRTSLNHFLWVCLSEYFKDQIFELSDDMLERYGNKILELPNITPNGLILPKLENQLAYNLVHRMVANSFSEIGLGNSISRIQYPINIRLQSGLGNSEADNRKRSSIKPHTDLWAGDPSAGIMAFLAVLGSVDSVGIEFLQPESFPVSFVKTLDDYSDGKEIAAGAKHLCNFKERSWFIVDPFVIHKTTKNNPGLRISIDFRFVLKERVNSDFDEDALRAPYFIPYAQWAEYGLSRFYTTKEKMEKYVNKNNEQYMHGYPVILSNLELK